MRQNLFFIFVLWAASRVLAGDPISSKKIVVPEAEAAFGAPLTRSISAEASYRAPGFDYEKDGLTYDVITHGVQVTIGLVF